MNVREILKEYAVAYLVQYLVYAGLVTLAILLLAAYTWVI